MPPERQFVGFDAYKQLIASGVDVVLLATPPHFRPAHLKAAVEAGVHVFAEKPVAVDAPGVRSVLATCEEAKKKRLSIVSGLCLRYSYGFQEVVKRIHDGQIGKVTTLYANDYRGGIWVKQRQPDWTDMHWQIRNWYYFTWLCGDFNVEQHVHFLDVCAWAMGDRYPAKAIGMGGRQQRTGPEYGNIYDHHSVVYEYDDGARLVQQHAAAAWLPQRHERPGDRHARRGLVPREPWRADGHVGHREVGLPGQGQQHLPDRARRAVCRHPQRQADQQRRVHGQEHAAWPSSAAWPLTPASRSLGSRP